MAFRTIVHRYAETRGIAKTSQYLSSSKVENHKKNQQYLTHDGNVPVPECKTGKGPRCLLLRTDVEMALLKTGKRFRLASQVQVGPSAAAFLFQRNGFTASSVLLCRVAQCLDGEHKAEAGKKPGSQLKGKKTKRRGPLSITSVAACHH